MSSREITIFENVSQLISNIGGNFYAFDSLKVYKLIDPKKTFSQAKTHLYDCTLQHAHASLSCKIY